MAAYSSYQHNPFLLDQFFHTNTSNTTSMFSQYYPSETLPYQVPVCVSNNNKEISEDTYVNCTDQSSSVADYIPEKGNNDKVVIDNMDKKRKSTASSLQLKEGKEVKGKRQRKSKILMEESEESKARNDKKNKKKVPEEAPADYIHVRARRGQATDSHSLAERVRREKISERMKVLQTLVPGCDKVTGKAVMLDEIINYVQSLQNQVEFLSMRLASTNPTCYDFGMDLDTLMVNPEAQRLNKLVSPLVFTNMEKYNSALPMSLSETTSPSIYSQSFPQGQIISHQNQPRGHSFSLLRDVIDFEAHDMHLINGTADKELPINLAASSFTNLWAFL